MSAGKVWAPENYDGKFRGPVTLQQALEESINVPTIRLLEEIGVNPVIDAARRAGIQSPLPRDLTLAHAALHPKGVICIDDMLHPAFPFLVVVVHDYLKRNPEMRLLCVIDREDIVGAPKFLLCRADAVALYESDLMTTFKAQHLTIGGDAIGHVCVVLTPHPRLVQI